MQTKKYHGIPSHTVGIIMKEAVGRGMQAIRSKLSTFVALEKPSETKVNDHVTDADTLAQKVMIKVIEESFPLAGIIAEESTERNDLPKPCTHKRQHLTFTIDPLDGTNAYVRKQSEGIGTMIALVETKGGIQTVIAVCIGDVMTDEIYYYKPGGVYVHRFHKDRHELLEYYPKKHQRLLLLDDMRLFPKIVAALTNPIEKKGFGYFDSAGSVNGSIGTNFARLWKGEVDAIILKEQYVTPWDVSPVYGISHKLGFKFIGLEQYDKKSIGWVELSISPLTVKKQPTTLVIHESKIDDIQRWFTKNGYEVKK